MDDGALPPTKRIRLSGPRFDGGRLPVDSLVELQSYQDAVRAMARHEWLRDHPGEAVPEVLDDSVRLTIERIDEGSADVFLAFETVAIYQEYQVEARDAVDATIRAAYAGTDLPEYPTETQDLLRQAVADLGKTLSPDQSIEFYLADDGSPVTIDATTRPAAVDHLQLSGFLLEPVEPEPSSTLATVEHTIVVHVTAIDADKMVFQMKDAEGRTIGGWYKDTPGLLEDLRLLVDSESSGPLTRVTGELQYRNGVPWRFRSTPRVERVAFDATPWGRVLSELAALPPGWADGGGMQISSIALDAAQAVMRYATHAEEPTVGPTEDGGVLLEWVSMAGIRSVEVLPDGSFELFSMATGDHRGHQVETADARTAAQFASEALHD